VQVRAVVDQLDGDPVVFEQRHDGARLAVVDRPHAVEQVGAQAGARFDAGAGHLVPGVGVADRGNGAGGDDGADRVQGAVQLRGERHDAEGAAARGEQPPDLRGCWRAQRRRVVGPAPDVAEPRALQVDAGEQAVGAQVGEHGQLTLEGVDRGGDEARQGGGRAAAAVELRGARGLVGVRAEE